MSRRAELSRSSPEIINRAPSAQMSRNSRDYLTKKKQRKETRPQPSSAERCLDGLSVSGCRLAAHGVGAKIDASAAFKRSQKNARRIIKLKARPH